MDRRMMGGRKRKFLEKLMSTEAHMQSVQVQ